MTSDRSQSWWLTTEQLVAACELLGVVELPGGFVVEELIDDRPILLDAGRRSLLATRLCVETPDGVACDPALADALHQLNRDDAHRVIDLWCGPDEHQVLIEHSDGAALIAYHDDAGAVHLSVGPADELRARIEQLVEPVTHAPAGSVGETCTLEAGRWERLLDGGALRRTDGPIVARALAAAQHGGVWQLGWLTQAAGDALTGGAVSWVIDADGPIAIELDDDVAATDDPTDPGAEPGVRLRCGAPLGALPQWSSPTT